MLPRLVPVQVAKLEVRLASLDAKWDGQAQPAAKPEADIRSMDETGAMCKVDSWLPLQVTSGQKHWALRCGLSSTIYTWRVYMPRMMTCTQFIAYC